MYMLIRRLSLSKASYVGPFENEQKAHDFAQALISDIPFVVVKLHVPAGVEITFKEVNNHAAGN